MFLQTLADDPLFFCGVAVTVVFSIVLHELAHGWVALWEGDDTPRATGHMTPNPIVHMGVLSIIMLLTCGIAFGAMPVNPARFRHRYGDALVAAAGPAMNLVLALAALTATALWIRAAGFRTEIRNDFAANAQRFVLDFGVVNLALVILNLLPIPPLDGSVVLANLHGGYRDFLRRIHNPQMFLIALLVILVVASRADLGLFDLAREASLVYVNLLSGTPLEVVR
jgi:Zn-dependent protease